MLNKNENYEIKGSVEGPITANTVIVYGSINGNIKSKNVIIKGRINGNIKSKKLLQTENEDSNEEILLARLSHPSCRLCSYYENNYNSLSRYLYDGYCKLFKININNSFTEAKKCEWYNPKIERL